MKKLIAKVRKIKMTRWNELTLGEKIADIVMKLVKIAVVAVIAVTVIGVILAVIAGIAIAFGIAAAISGGFADASRAYRPGDYHIWFR